MVKGGERKGWEGESEEIETKREKEREGGQERGRIKRIKMERKEERERERESWEGKEKKMKMEEKKKEERGGERRKMERSR